MTTPDYALGHTDEEYTRLRRQARVWESATGRVLDQITLAPGSRCLDAGCGPGETMRMLAARVGPAGQVLGVDVDGALGERAIAVLHDAGHRQCRFERLDLSTAQAIPGGPFDLVFARVLLFHLAERVAVLRALWDAVAPGGHLLVQDYDMPSLGVRPSLDSFEALAALIAAAFTAAGGDVEVGARLPALFSEAGIGAPDGTDVAGRLEPLGDAARMFGALFASLRPGVVASGVATEETATQAADAFARDAARFPDRPVLWPLLIGAWKRKAR